MSRTYHHGTNTNSAELLLAGAELNETVARKQKIDGPSGFFLATRVEDAEFFALRRISGAFVTYTFSDAAFAQLLKVGAVERPIPRERNSPFFRGMELYLPPKPFKVFNALAKAGEITVTAV